MQNIFCPKNSECATRSYLLFFGNVMETQVPHWPLSAIRLLCESFNPGVFNCQSLDGEKEWVIWRLAVSPLSHGNEQSFGDVTVVLGLTGIDLHSAQWSQSEPISKPSACSHLQRTHVSSATLQGSSRTREWGIAKKGIFQTAENDPSLKFYVLKLIFKWKVLKGYGTHLCF